MNQNWKTRKKKREKRKEKRKKKKEKKKEKKNRTRKGSINMFTFFFKKKKIKTEISQIQKEKN